MEGAGIVKVNLYTSFTVVQYTKRKRNGKSNERKKEGWQ